MKSMHRSKDRIFGRICELKTNMRIVSSSKGNRQFSIDLLQIVNGVNDFITLNNLCILVKNVEELTEKVNPDIITYPLRH